MCLEVFVAADEPLPIIPFDPAAPAFNVDELWPEVETVRKQFSKPFVYSLGSQGGCACGFRYDPPELALSILAEDGVPEEIKQNERNDYAARQETIRQLKRFLTAAVGENSSVQMYSCWVGDETAEPESRCTVTLDHFGGQSFEFVEKQFLTVVPRHDPS